MTHYYSEWDAYCAQWLRNLIDAKLIPTGDVDERSIKDVQPDDLKGYVQCHFFAGIAGWPLALRMAGWPDDREVWTGSCPCQPFSVAGFRGGFDDERHLWPDWLRLISKRRPPTIFGEQVAAASAWLALVRSDLETLGFAVGALPVEAASADAEHFRDRYWFVAHDDRQQPGEGLQRSGQFSGAGSATKDHSRPVADGDNSEWRASQPTRNFSVGPSTGRQQGDGNVAERSDLTLVYAPLNGWGQGWTEHEFRSRGFTAAVASIDDRQYVECPDGKWRRLPPPGVRWLGTKLPARVAKLRALGNAIDSRPASAFVAAFMECRP